MFVCQLQNCDSPSSSFLLFNPFPLPYMFKSSSQPGQVCIGVTMELPALVLVIFLLACGLFPSMEGSGGVQEFDSSDEGPESGFLSAPRTRRAPEVPPQDKCSYTFIVPQQKVTGAICVMCLIFYKIGALPICYLLCEEEKKYS